MTEPTGYTAVGMVGFTDKGTYSASASYVKNDLVHYGGSIWCCLIDDTTGITPTEGTNWTLFVGEPTNMAERIIAPLEVSPSENAYSIGEQLIFNDALYKAKTAIAVGDALVVDTNIELAPKISSQIQTLSNKDTAIESEISDVVNVLGSKNLLPNYATTQVVNGITFTVNDDGTVTANGTATSYTEFRIKADLSFLEKNTYYTLNGCPSGGSENTYSLMIRFKGYDVGNGLTFIYDDSADLTTMHVSIRINEGITVSNLTFKPMIRPASIKDSTYVPYAMTNRELTDSIGKWENLAYTKSTGLDATVIVRINRALKLVMVSFNSLNSTTGGTITLSDATLKFATDVFSAMRYNGYLKALVNTNQVVAEFTSAFTVGSVIAPIL